MSVTLPRLGWLVAGVLLLVSACTNGKLVDRRSDRYDRQDLVAALQDPEAGAGLVLGVFPLAPNAVVDGDTIKVAGLDASLRLLAIDTEETWKSSKDFKLYERLGFEKYLEAKTAKSSGPYKGATPLGMDAKVFADDFFRSVTHVRLERDHPKEIRGLFGRFLTYVFVERDGEWINYNVECVRAGMSPYFAKYGYSRRFHDEFVQAQEEARENQRGIWDPNREHYRDYDVRLDWWNGRGAFLEAFEEQAAGRDDHIVLTHWDSLDRLADAEGKEVWLLGAVGGIRPAKGNAPTRVLLSRRMFSNFALVFFDDRVFERSNIGDAAGEFVVVRGTVTSYRFKGKRGKPGSKQLQIVVRNPEQVVAWSASLRNAGRALDGRHIPRVGDDLPSSHGAVPELDDASDTQPPAALPSDELPDDASEPPSPIESPLPEPPASDPTLDPGSPDPESPEPGSTDTIPPPPPPPPGRAHARLFPAHATSRG